MDYYKQYRLSPEFGFLPHQAPLTQFHTEALKPLDALADRFTDLVQQKIFFKEIQQLPILDFDSIDDSFELELAYLYYAVFAHGFVWETGVSTGYLPANIVLPWLQICAKLDRVPILTYNSIVMYNWKLDNPNKKIGLDNISTIVRFNELIDEAWFFLLSVELEYIGSPIVVLGIELVSTNYQIKKDKRAAFLTTLCQSILEITTCLSRMYEKCDPYKFYKYLRPFLTSFEAVEYRGATKDPIRSYHGGSAAQSSLIQLIDCILQIGHGSEHAGK